MTDVTAMPRAPAKLLLATDLSARCDRALERAVALAAEWNAHLTILHVFEEAPGFGWSRHERASPSWRRPPDAAQVAKQRIRRSLRADLGEAVERATVLVEDGDAAEVIVRVAAAQQATLVVTGVARDAPFGRAPVRLGRTVEALLRSSPAPLLVVANRPRSPYAHLLATTDFSAVSGEALRTALRLFPLQSLHLLHAFEPAHAALAPDPARYAESFGAALAQQMSDFLNSLGLAAGERARIAPLIERGNAADLVRQYVHDRGADLVVLGTHGRGPVLEALIGSTAKTILETLPCDGLVVRGGTPVSGSTGGT